MRVSDEFQFQPTRPRGARQGGIRDLRGPGGVSTHAPTRSATAWRPRPCRCCPGFNPRAHAERDIDGRGPTRGWARFNPRAHAERDGIFITPRLLNHFSRISANLGPLRKKNPAAILARKKTFPSQPLAPARTLERRADHWRFAAGTPTSATNRPQGPGVFGS